ncbi:DUF6508 domain-containing protein [Streptomyces stramineus]
MRALLGLGDPDDWLLLAQLRDDHEAWRSLREAAAALTDEDRTVRWGGGGQQPDGTHLTRHPVYGERLRRAVGALSAVGAVTPRYRWMDHPVPVPGPDGRLSATDAVRAATALVRGERFCDGTIADAAGSGLLDATLAALLAWHEERAGGAGAPA